MKKINNIISALTILVITAGVLLVSDVKADRSWDDDKTEGENVLWEQKIEEWDKTVKAWDERRDKLHEQYYRDNYEDRAKYCNDIGECWEEDMFHLIFTSTSGESQEMEKSRGDVNNEGMLFEDGSRWGCTNGGQVLIFNKADGEFWQSRNTGQVIEYKNANGDHWESSNTGQVIKFVGANGEKWQSSNYGQVVEYTDKDGNEWSGSDSDDVDDMIWRN
jgi:hypothetical protein